MQNGETTPDPGLNQELQALETGLLRNPNQAKETLKTLLSRVNSRTNPGQHIHMLFLLGACEHYTGNPKRSLEYIQQAMQLAEQHQHPLLTRIHNSLGLAYKQVGQPELALHHLQIALERAEQEQDQDVKFRALNNLAVYYRDQNDLQTALPLQQKAFKIAHEQANPFFLSAALSSLIGIHVKLGQYETALCFMEQGLATIEKHGAARWISWVKRMSSVAQLALNRHDEALSTAREALHYAEACTDAESIVDAHRQNAKVYQQMRSPDLARAHYTAALNLAEEHGLQGSYLNCLTELNTLNQTQSAPTPAPHPQADLPQVNPSGFSPPSNPH